MNRFVKNLLVYVLIVGGLFFGLAVYFITTRQYYMSNSEPKNDQVKKMSLTFTKTFKLVFNKICLRLYR